MLIHDYELRFYCIKKLDFFKKSNFYKTSDACKTSLCTLLVGHDMQSRRERSKLCISREQRGASFTSVLCIELP